MGGRCMPSSRHLVGSNINYEPPKLFKEGMEGMTKLNRYVSRIDRFSLGPIGGGFQGGRDGSRGEQGSSQRY